MHYFFEAFFIGLYSAAIYLVVSLFYPFIDPFIDPLWKTLYAVGCIKHLGGYFLGLHTYYCNHGYACGKNGSKNGKNSKNPQYHRNTDMLTILLETQIEGILFMGLGWLLCKVSSQCKKYTLLLFFMIGFLLHILFEVAGIHKQFCDEQCSKITLLFEH